MLVKSKLNFMEGRQYAEILKCDEQVSQLHDAKAVKTLDPVWIHR